MTDNAREQLLFGSLSQAEFLRDYWQQKPLLFRQALPDFKPGIRTDEVAGLALEDSIESRLVTETPGARQPWTVRHGPFSEQDLTSLPASHWSLLVQAVDQWVPEVSQLLSEFKFLPAWRLDDIMISIAPDQGSVGPHYDQYDVFLLQVEGHRRWTVGAPCDPDTPIIEGAPLRILRQGIPEPTQVWDLAPGDMLYLPPRYAHHGVALDTCMTWSVGFRAPDAYEALHGLALRAELEDDIEFLRYSDANISPAEATDRRLSAASLDRLRGLLTRTAARDEVLADWLGAYMTQNKYDLFDWQGTENQLEADAANQMGDMAEDVMVRGALPTRMTAWGTRLYVNGRAFVLEESDRPLIDLLLNGNRWRWQSLWAASQSDSARRTLNVLLLSGSLERADGDDV